MDKKPVDVVWITGNGFGNVEAARLFNDNGRKSVLLSYDEMPLSRDTYASAAAAAAMEGTPTLLINNFFTPLEDCLIHEYDETSLAMAFTQFDAFSYFTKRAIPHFQNGGLIINIVPALGVIPARAQPLISSLSSGVIGMTKAWALELSHLGFRVCAIAVGFTNEKNAQFTYPAIKQVVTPKDIYELVISLENTKMLDGSCILLDGGYVAGYVRDF